VISKLSILHDCTNEESYFYLKSCFHTRSSSAGRGDIIVLGKGTCVVNVRQMIVLFSCLPPVIGGALPHGMLYYLSLL